MKARYLLLLLPLLWLGACASRQTTEPDPPPDEKTLAVKNVGIHEELIEQMLDNGEYYAALAHIQDERRRSGPTEELSLLEAEARRHLGQRKQADALYRQLLNGSQAAAAYHGLGLLFAQSGDLNTAARCLHYAVERAPTSVDYRNDLGYALMQAGRYGEALPELSTAAELAPNQVRNRNNLIELMMLMNNESAVARLAEQAGSTPTELKRLRDDAQVIRNKVNAAPKAAG
jgi:tight adherence protein D